MSALLFLVFLVTLFYSKLQTTDHDNTNRIGPRIWWTKVSSIVQLPYLSTEYPELPVVDLAICMLCGMMLFTQIPVSILRVREACKAKKTSFSEALSQVVPYLQMSYFAYLWTMSPKSIIQSQCLVLFLSAWGVAFGRIAASVILRHVTHLEYPTYNFLLAVFGLGALLTRGGDSSPLLDFHTPQRELTYIWIMFTIIVGEYLFWVTRVIYQFCDYLGIECFRIKSNSLSNEKSTSSAAQSEKKQGMSTPVRRSARLRQMSSWSLFSDLSQLNHSLIVAHHSGCQFFSVSLEKENMFDKMNYFQRFHWKGRYDAWNDLCEKSDED